MQVVHNATMGFPRQRTNLMRNATPLPPIPACCVKNKIHGPSSALSSFCLPIAPCIFNVNCAVMPHVWPVSPTRGLRGSPLSGLGRLVVLLTLASAMSCEPACDALPTMNPRLRLSNPLDWPYAYSIPDSNLKMTPGRAKPLLTILMLSVPALFALTAHRYAIAIKLLLYIIILLFLNEASPRVPRALREGLLHYT